MVTTVAPTMPVDAARKAPTTTTDTARPPGSGPNTRAMVVRRSLAIRERSSVMPMSTNIATASSVSIDWPARTRSFIRLTMKVRVRKNAPSAPRSNSGATSVGRSGWLNREMSWGLTPLATSSANAGLLVSMTSRSRSPDSPRTASRPNEIRAAPPIAKATGKPDMMPANRQANTRIRPSSTPSNPSSMRRDPLVPPAQAAGVGASGADVVGATSGSSKVASKSR